MVQTALTLTGMPYEPLTIRQEYLLVLEPFCQALHRAFVESGASAAQIADVMRVSVSAECVGCHLQVSGEELFALSQPPSPEHATAKIGRLRLGQCARYGCEACYYRLEFKAHPPFAWKTLLDRADKLRPAEPENPAEHPPGMALPVVTKLAELPRLKLGFVLPRRVWLGVAAVLLLLVVRQWYTGGRIPLLREPEHFHVDALEHEVRPGPTHAGD